MALDFFIKENGSGSDILVINGDAKTSPSLKNIVYLNCFGGNPFFSTKNVEDGAERGDYWGNELFHKNEPALQFNSDTQSFLQETVLVSGAVSKIEDVIKRDNDLFSEIFVTAKISSANRLDISLEADSEDVFLFFEK